jgi:calnexin
LRTIYDVTLNTMHIKIVTAIVSLLIIFSNGKCDEVDDSEEAIVETEEPVIDIPYESPEPLDPKRIYLAEHFDDLDQFAKRWVKSQAKKEGISEDIAKYDGEWQIEGAGKDGLVGDKGLVLKSKAKHAAIASSLLKPFNFDTKPLIVQYEVIFQDGQECGGAYLKLLSQGPETQNLNNFHDKTPYSIMFGPDKCGNDHKLHFIFKHRNPLNGSLEEKHCKKPKERIEDAFSDKLPHLFTLVLQPDNTFEISLDRKIVNSGSLLEDFTPTVNPPKEIDDPNDKKPEDWDEREKIADPEAVKPDDWDEDAPAQIVDESAVMPEGWLENEPTHIPDPDAKKPDDWDTEMDGEWEPPLIDNPLCKDAVGCGSWEPPLINNPEFKGKWRAPLIDNPNYKGKWRPRRIANPEFFEDKHPFKMQAVSAVGFELWSMSKDIFFDNVIITDDLAVADHWAAATFDKKRQKIAKDSESVIQKLATLTNEYPWLWGVYILVLGIPVVLVLYLCCKPGSSASQSQEKEELRQAAQNKKTDEPTEDVEEEAKEEVEEAEVENPEDDDREKNSGPDTDEEEESEGKTEDHSPKGSGDGARKRKVRKE